MEQGISSYIGGVARLNVKRLQVRERFLEGHGLENHGLYIIEDVQENIQCGCDANPECENSGECLRPRLVIFLKLKFHEGWHDAKHFEIDFS